MPNGNGKEKKKKKKEGWKDLSKSLKCVIVLQPDFQGVLFALDQVPLRKIGVESSKIVLAGKPVQTVMNTSHPQAPEYRIVITNKELRLYVKGMPPVLLQ